MAWSPTSYIYGLRFSGDDIFYVGKARNTASRMKGHLSRAKSPDTPLYRHIANGLVDGRALEMDILEVCDLNTESEREAFWIWELANQVFNRMVPGWSVLTAEESAEMLKLDEQIKLCKSRMTEIVNHGRQRKKSAELTFRRRPKTEAISLGGRA